MSVARVLAERTILRSASFGHAEQRNLIKTKKAELMADVAMSKWTKKVP